METTKQNRNYTSQCQMIQWRNYPPTWKGSFLSPEATAKRLVPFSFQSGKGLTDVNALETTNLCTLVKTNQTFWLAYCTKPNCTFHSSTQMPSFPSKNMNQLHSSKRSSCIQLGHMKIQPFFFKILEPAAFESKRQKKLQNLIHQRQYISLTFFFFFLYIRIQTQNLAIYIFR